jgi:hypothetical protein
MDNTRELTREEWLTNAAELMAPLFISAGVTPKPVRISVGFPANKRAGKGKVIGECHYMATDGIPQVFIHPSLTDGDMGPLPTLAHELAHAYLPVGTGHKGKFVQLVRALGLAGRPTSTQAGEEFNTDMQGIADVLGEYPHAALDTSNIKKQGTRSIKITCYGFLHMDENENPKPLIWRTSQANIDRTHLRCMDAICADTPIVG